MDAFEACAACARHIKRVESACPFCHAPHSPSAPAARRPIPRVSRAAWLVTTLATTMASSLAVAGCGGVTLGDPPKGHHATGESAEQEAADASDRDVREIVADDAGVWPAFDAPFVVTGDAGLVVDEASVYAEAGYYPDAGYDADLYDAGDDVGWVGCYGAPPARLERTAPARLGAQA
jgi:hypothetical protein